MNIGQRLEAVREVLRREHLAAFIFPTTDPHQSEYTADHWKGRQWVSGFDGSAGTAVVTLTAAALWTDSRYFIAAEQQLAGTGYRLMKQKVEGTPTIAEWLGRQLAEEGESTEVGIDGAVASATTVRELIAELRKQGGLTLRTNLDLLAQVWTARPPMPQTPVEIQPLEYAGETAHSKIDRLRREIFRLHADGMLVTALDDIAWTLNIRGADVHCNPVTISYLLIAPQRATLYINKVKLSPQVTAYLKGEGVDVDDYDRVGEGLSKYSEYNILLDPDEVSYSLFSKVNRPVVEAQSPVAQMKCVKNTAEIEGFRRAMERDGVAMVRFLRWLKPAVEAGGQTEMSIDRKLTALRAALPLYRGLSFDTIAGYEAHGAIVHYEATADSDAVLKPEGLLLLDSGAQYQDGTTDITRTIALGPVTAEQRRVYTLVLKAHIQLEMAKFPSGISGTQIDAIARQPLWREGLNYLHGTGHGVGSYLNVHEGLHQIRMEHRPAPLRQGMTVTDEPGIYLEGRFGVRIENTLLITQYRHTECGEFLQFEPLTLCPIDTEPIDTSLLTPEEAEWLNAYHHMVCQRLGKYLDGDDAEWLQKKCSPLTL